jgi:GNAT superfamily N-acetyltransferase
VRRQANSVAPGYVRLQINHPFLHAFSTAFTAPGYDHSWAEQQFAASHAALKTGALHDIHLPDAWTPKDWGESDEDYAARSAEHKQRHRDALDQVRTEVGDHSLDDYAAQQRWHSGVRRALTLGHLSIDEAKQRGFRPADSREAGTEYTDDDYQKRTRGGWQPLPPKVFHVSTHADDVQRNGLKTRQELGGVGTGLGGGHGMDQVSVTADEKLGPDIYHGLHEHHAYLNGKISTDQLLDYAKHPPVGKPFHDELTHSISSDVIEKARSGTEHYDLPTLSDYHKDKPGWEPSSHFPEGHPLAGQPQTWSRRLGPEEQLHARTEMYKGFAHMRGSHFGGQGHRNPLFMSNDPIAFAKTDPAKFGILHLRSHPGAQGFPLDGAHGKVHEGADSGEWRLGPGSPFDVEKVDKPRPRHLDEFGLGDKTAAWTPPPNRLPNGDHVAQYGDAGPGGQYNEVLGAHHGETGEYSGHLATHILGSEHHVAYMEVPEHLRGRGTMVGLLDHYRTHLMQPGDTLHWGNKTPEGARWIEKHGAKIAAYETGPDGVRRSSQDRNWNVIMGRDPHDDGNAPPRQAPKPVKHKIEDIDDRTYSVRDVDRANAEGGLDTALELEGHKHEPEKATFRLQRVPVDSLRSTQLRGGQVVKRKAWTVPEMVGHGDDYDEMEHERINSIREGGEHVPPIVVVKHGPHHVIVDGAHRAGVAMENGESHVPAFVTDRDEGVRREAADRGFGEHNRFLERLDKGPEDEPYLHGRRDEYAKDVTTHTGHSYTLMTHGLGLGGDSTVTAHRRLSNGKYQGVGYLSWFGGNPEREGREGNTSPGTIYKAHVAERHRRRGVASAMLDFARERYPHMDVRHSTALSDDGRAWAEKKASRLPKILYKGISARALGEIQRSGGLQPSEMGESGPGVYLTHDHEYAKHYAGMGYGGGAVLHVEHSVQNPLVRNLDDEHDPGDRKYRNIQQMTPGGSLNQGGALGRALAEHGHDAVETTWRGRHEIAVHDPAKLRIVHVEHVDGEGNPRTAVQAPPEGLSFEYSETQSGGSKWPTRHQIGAVWPGEPDRHAGVLNYFTSPTRKKVLIENLSVPHHPRNGIGSALMDELQRRHPEASIDHGDRTDDGKAWWAGYTDGKSVRRGRTAALDDDDYRMQHRPPGRDGIPIHDMTVNLPADIYTHPHYYSDMSEPSAQHAHRIINQVRGKPDARVHIYRALPAEHAHQGFRPGDWVTTSKDYARQHGTHAVDPKHDWPVIHAVVKADDLHTDGDDFREFGYNGTETKPGNVAFKGGYHQEISDRAEGGVRQVQRRQGPLTGKGYSFTAEHDHIGGTGGTIRAWHHDDYAGHMHYNADGSPEEPHIEPEHQHLAEELTRRMRMKLPPRTGAVKQASRVVPCTHCKGRGTFSNDKGQSWACPTCHGDKTLEQADHWDPPELPQEQREAQGAEDHRDYSAKSLQLAKNPVPGTVVWRGEIRHKDDLHRPPSVGMHWSVKPEQATALHPPTEMIPEDHHKVLWEARVDDPEKQTIPRSHPVWYGRHRSMDSEAEVRFKPGTKVHLQAAYLHDGRPGRSMLSPLNSEYSAAGWTKHPMGVEVPIEHKRNRDDGMMEYQEHFPDLFKNASMRMVRPSQVWDHIRTDVHPHRLDTIRDSVAEHGWQPDWNVADGPIKVSLDPPAVSNGSHRLHVLRELGHDEPIPMQVTAATSPVLYHGSMQRFEKGTVLTPDKRAADGSIHSGDWVYATTDPESARYFASMHDTSPESDSPVHIHRVEPIGDVEPDVFLGERDKFSQGNYRAKALRVLDHQQVPGHWAKQASLSDEDRVSVAEQAMERGGHTGRSWHVPAMHRDDPARQEAQRPVHEFVNGVLSEYGRGPVRVSPKHWDLRSPGSGRALYDHTYGTIGLKGEDTNDLELLHEMAHAITGKPGHDREFVQAAHSLYQDHLGPEAAETFRNVVSPPKQATRTTPHDRVFGPTYGLDVRLWENEKLREPIRDDIIARWRTFCLQHRYRDWSSWVKIVFFGSEASEWTGPGQIGNGDFDLSIGIEYDRFRATNPNYAQMADAEIADMFTEQMHAELNDPAHLFPDTEGSYDNTWFANLQGYHIERMRPYAAYDVIARQWIVKPPHLPDWDVSKLPVPMRRILRAAETTARNTLKLREPDRTLQAARLYDMWHADRSNAFGEQGEGWYDIGNLREKYLDQLGLWGPLAQAHHRAAELAPLQWDNTPHFAKLPKSQKCKYCKQQATQRVIHSEGMAYVPACDEHLDKAKHDAARCTPDGSVDPSNIDAVRKIAAAYEHQDAEDEECENCGGAHPTEACDEEGDHKTDWASIWPHVTDLHRGINTELPPHVHQVVHDSSRPIPERAHALMQHLQSGHHGMHWTDSPEQAEHYTTSFYGPGATPVRISGHKPDRDWVEEDDDRLRDERVLGYEHHDDREVPLQPHAPVAIHSVSWGDHGSHELTHHHRFDHPLTVHASMTARDYEGEVGNRDHITRGENGALPIDVVRNMHGARGEIPGEHRNRQGQAWEDFKADIAANGIKEPIFITVDHGQEPVLSEGSHRRDAAVELGHSHIPAEVRYFGHAEQQGTVEERARHHRLAAVHPADELRMRNPEITDDEIEQHLRGSKTAPWFSATPGGPTEIHYIRNNGGMRKNTRPEEFGQQHEPWGRYYSENQGTVPHGWESGVVHFDNPLHVPHGAGGWKSQLSAMHDGATGKELSSRLLAAGHDGVITHDEYGTSEIVDVRPRDQRTHVPDRLASVN